MVKRLFDIVASACALIVLSPILVTVIVVLRLTGEGEVFYRQMRIGRGGEPFGILKFATMRKNSAQLPGGDITIGNDERILPVGRILRKTKINELPQLYNILIGDMSVIGYRPLTKRVADFFPPEHWLRLGHLRPGLSGAGSLFFRDEESLLDGVNDREGAYRLAIAPYKMELEGWYADRQDFLLDMKIVVLTAVGILRRDLDLQRYLPQLPPIPPELERLRAASVSQGRAGTN